MSDARYFDRLLETAGLIARHADYPGKQQVIDRCREEVEDLTSSGTISTAEAAILQEILQGAKLHAVG